MQELQIVDTLKGAIKEDANGDIQFLLVPGETALKMYRRSILKPRALCSTFRSALCKGATLQRGKSSVANLGGSCLGLGFVKCKVLTVN